MPELTYRGELGKVSQYLVEELDQLLAAINADPKEEDRYTGTFTFQDNLGVTRTLTFKNGILVGAS